MPTDDDRKADHTFAFQVSRSAFKDDQPSLADLELRKPDVPGLHLLNPPFAPTVSAHSPESARLAVVDRAVG